MRPAIYFHEDHDRYSVIDPSDGTILAGPFDDAVEAEAMIREWEGDDRG